MGYRLFIPEFQNGRLVKLDGQRPEYMGGNDIRNGYLADAAIADSQARFYTRCANIVCEYLNMGNEK